MIFYSHRLHLKSADNMKNALRKQFPLFDASGQSTITRCAIWVFTFSELVGEEIERARARGGGRKPPTRNSQHLSLRLSISFFAFFLESFEPTEGMCARRLEWPPRFSRESRIIFISFPRSHLDRDEQIVCSFPFFSTLFDFADGKLLFLDVCSIEEFFHLSLI